MSDTISVVASSFDSLAPYVRRQPPDFGVYLDPRWNPPWPHQVLDWPDFGVPADPAAFKAQAEDVLKRASGGQVVEIGCLGGHGRTGTLMSALTVLTGTPPADAVGWVRARYCDRAVESSAQQEFILGLTHW